MIKITVFIIVIIVNFWILPYITQRTRGLLSYLENGPFENMGITKWFYMPYFKPTIDFNMLQYISSSDLQFSNSLQVS